MDATGCETKTKFGGVFGGFWVFLVGFGGDFWGEGLVPIVLVSLFDKCFEGNRR